MALAVLPPGVVQGNPKFNHDPINSLLRSHDTEFRPGPAHLHCKIPLKYSYGVIWSIYPLLGSAEPDVDNCVLFIRVVRSSNALYRSEVASLFDPARVYTMPLLSNDTQVPLQQDIARDLGETTSKTELTKVLRFKEKYSSSISSGELVQFCIKQDTIERGKGSSPRVFHSIDNQAGTVTASGSCGKGFVLQLNTYKHLLSQKALP